MNRNFKALLLVFLVVIIPLSAQTKKGKGSAKSNTVSSAASTSSKGGLTPGGANQIIVYSNSIGSFFSNYFNLKHVAEYGSNVKTAFNERGQKTRTTVYDSYRNVRSFDDALALFNEQAESFRNQGKSVVDPTLPPAIIGSEKVKAFNSEWQNIKTAYADCLAAREEIRKYVDSDLELREKKNEKNLKEAILVYDEKVNGFYGAVDRIYQNIEEIGDMAEEVTLAKHPMKIEIMDMRKSLRIAQAANKIITTYDDPAALEVKLPELSELNNQLKIFVTKYSKYDYQSGSTFRIQSIKGSIKSFYESATKMSELLDMLPNEYKANFSKVESMSKSHLSYMNLSYQEFVQQNNSR